MEWVFAICIVVGLINSISKDRKQTQELKKIQDKLKERVDNTGEVFTGLWVAQKPKTDKQRRVVVDGVTYKFETNNGYEGYWDPRKIYFFQIMNTGERRWYSPFSKNNMVYYSLHRLNGMAVEYHDGYGEYYLQGIFYTPEEHAEKVAELKSIFIVSPE